MNCKRSQVQSYGFRVQRSGFMGYGLSLTSIILLVGPQIIDKTADGSAPYQSPLTRKTFAQHDHTHPGKRSQVQSSPFRVEKNQTACIKGIVSSSGYKSSSLNGG